MRRDVFDKHGLYEHCIVGSGDHYMAHAALGDIRNECVHRNMRDNSQQLRHLQEWSDNFYSTVRGGLKAVPGRVLHLWHGEMVTRRYWSRHQEVMKYQFDPYKDLISIPGRPFEFNHESIHPDLVGWFQAYFKQRQEDGNQIEKLAV